jgi:hypothetical protein
MTFKEYDFCMRRKCKNCKLDGECKYINRLHETRLLWHPFENIKEIVEKKNDT